VATLTGIRTRIRKKEERKEYEAAIATVQYPSETTSSEICLHEEDTETDKHNTEESIQAECSPAQPQM
jgi:hypothetical protein